MVSGASIVAQNLAENMAARGHEVLVITASDRGESYKTINGNLTVLRLRSTHNPFRVGQKIMLPSRKAFKRALNDFRPDIIHSHDALQLGLLSLAYKRKHNIPVFLTIHALPHFAAKYIPAILSGFRPTLETLMWLYAWIILPKFDAVSTPTLTTSGTVYAMTNIKPLSISNGVDLDEFTNTRVLPEVEISLRKKLGIPLNIPIILHVGRLDIDKRVYRVICAAERPLRETNAHLLLIGDGCQKPALKKLCKKIGIEKKCHFPGYVSKKEGLPEIYRMANLFITASEIETQGIVLLEAAASGLPIVASWATCIPEIVHDGENGYLAAPDDVHSLGNAILDILSHPNKAIQMGKNGRSLVKEHNIQASFTRYEQVYAELKTTKQAQPVPFATKARQSWIRAKEWMSMFSSISM
jgi:glycosyltransferase involved in cell wall biosynthesis